MEKKDEKVVESAIGNNVTEGNNIPTEVELTKVIIVDFTAFNSRGEKIFFGRQLGHVKAEIMLDCETAVIHKTTEYDMSVLHKTETKIDKPVTITSKHEENILSLLKARRNILKVAKSVINERVSKKLIKRSDDLDDILMNDKLD